MRWTATDFKAERSSTVDDQQFDDQLLEWTAKTPVVNGHQI